jgi:hypothetical protein
MSSQALASARKRRSIPDPVVPPPGQVPGRPGQPGVAGQGLTIQQVVAVVDKRLLTLETFMKDVQQNGGLTANTESTSQINQNTIQTGPEVPENLKELLEEYGSRFDIIADELASIKNMMLSLQSFTMDVNKKLMDERIHILSSEDMPNITISHQSSDAEGEISIEHSS